MIKIITGAVLVSFGVYWTIVSVNRNTALTFNEIFADPSFLVGTTILPIIVIVIGLFLLIKK